MLHAQQSACHGMIRLILAVVFHSRPLFAPPILAEPRPDGASCTSNCGCCSRLCISNVCKPPGTVIPPPVVTTCPATPGTTPVNTEGWDCPGNPKPQDTCTAACTYTGTAFEAVCSDLGSWVVTAGSCECVHFEAAAMQMQLWNESHWREQLSAGCSLGCTVHVEPMIRGSAVASLAGLGNERLSSSATASH